MPATGPHHVDPADEGRHQPGPERWWNESWYCDLVDDSGAVAAYVRLGLHPNQQAAWWTAAVVGPDRPCVLSVDLALPLPAPDALTVERGATSVVCEVVDPLRTFRVVASAPGEVYADQTDLYRGVAGSPTTVDLDLTWTTDGVPHHYDVTTRYEIPCLAEGRITVGDEVLHVRGQGQRDHSWAPRDWWSFDWCWFAGRLDDGTRVHGADIRVAPELRLSFGYRQEAGEVHPITTGLVVDEVLGAADLPTTATIVCEPAGVDLAVETIAFGPLLFVDAGAAGAPTVDHFPRAYARFTTPDGRTGLGWIEWNQVQPLDRTSPAG